MEVKIQLRTFSDDSIKRTFIYLMKQQMAIENLTTKSFEEMRQKGIKGILYFWCCLLLILIPAINTFFALYVLIINAASIWVKAVGADLLVISLFIMIFSIISFVFLILSKFGVAFGFDIPFCLIVSTIAAIAGLISQASLLSKTTEYQKSLLVEDLSDYCIRNAQDSKVRQFIRDHASSYAIDQYTQTRTTRIYGATATFFAIWLVLVILHFVFMKLLQPKQETTANSNQNEDVPPSPDQLQNLTPES